ncbi:MAG: hypothetical protein ACJ74H_03200, partial [Thermoanaerobaculia bacterium]
MKPRRRRLVLGFSIVLALVIVVLLYSTEWLASLGGLPQGARLERVRRSPHYAGGKFRNAEQNPNPRTSNREMLRRQLFGDEQRAPLHAIPVVRPAYSTPAALAATWMGWSSV